MLVSLMGHFRDDGLEPSSGPDASAALERGVLVHGDLIAGRYRVERKLGAGGMGAVYEAFDQSLDEAIALKLLHGELSRRAEHRGRLRDEVRMARRVSHPNVCRVHDIGQHEGQLFVTMELVPGETLRNLLEGQRARRGEPVPLARKIDITVQICTALAAAHRAGVLHRDVKPDNVILHGARVVLTDFGVAGLLADAANAQTIVGTPSYIAPEVLRGEPHDHRVDVFSCAVVAYELIAATLPFPNTPGGPSGGLEAAIARARSHRQPPALPDALGPPRAKRGLDDALARALQSNPMTRTASVDAFALELAEAARDCAPQSVWIPPAGRSDATAETLAGDSAASDLAETGSSTPAATASAGFSPGLETKQAASTQPTQPTQPVHVPTASPAHRDGAARSAPSQLRIATALSFCRRDSREATATIEQRTRLTAPLLFERPGESLERTVVDLGGTPLTVAANEIRAVFGAPVSLGDDAARAARAAHALLAQSVGGHAAIDTARILYRHAPSGPMASGEAIERADALRETADEGQLLATPPAARQLAGRFRLREVADDDARRALLIEPTVDDSHAAQADLLGGSAHSITHCGHERELETLTRLVRRACETRQPGWASVVAPPGFGKTRLRRALMRRIDEQREVDWLVGRAPPMGELAPLSLMRSANAAWTDSAEEAGNSSGDMHASLAAAQRWLEDRAARRPVGLLLDDVQWSDSASLDLLSQLYQQLRDVPVAIISFSRNAPPENRPWAAAPVIELGPLGSDVAQRIARAIAPRASTADIRELERRAAGNPFFLEELARDLDERGPRSSHLTPLPATVEAVVQGRLDRLPRRIREVARAASVVGQQFWRDAARAALSSGVGADREMGEAEFDACLAELEHRAVVAPLPPRAVDDERYQFSSALVRDVAYQQLRPRQRRDAHRAVADWLTARDGEGATPGAGQAQDPALLAAIARHRDLAGQRDAAHLAYARAGRRSLDLFAHDDAVKTLRRAEALAEAPGPELLEDLGGAIMAAGSAAEAEATYLRALAGFEDRSSLHAARILGLLCKCATSQSKNQEAIEYGRRGLALLEPGGTPTAEALSHPELRASLYGALAWVLGYVMNDNDAGLEYGERAVALLENTPHKRGLAEALSRLGANYMRAGRWRDQLSANQRNLAIAEELRDLPRQITARVNLGVTYSSLGQFAEAEKHTRTALSLARRTGARGTLGIIHNNLGGWLLGLGRLDEAEAELVLALEFATKYATATYVAECHMFIARIALARGNRTVALSQARLGLAIAERSRADIDEGITARIAGGILALGGEFTEAEGLLLRSARLLEKTDAFEHARTEAQLARLYARRAQHDDATRAAELRARIVQLFERLGAAADLAQVSCDDAVL